MFILPVLLLAFAPPLNATPGTLLPAGQSQLMPDSLDPGLQPGRDDPGNIWLSYDDSMAAQYFEERNLWFRVEFVPESAFELVGIRIMIFNSVGSESPLELYVYSQNQQSGNLEERLWSTETNDLPTEEWLWFELAEDVRSSFDENEKFSIIYGPAPGGDPWDGEGWQGLGDRPPVQQHSFVASGEAPPVRFDGWSRLNSDLMLRANGYYTGEYADLAVTEITNHPEPELRRWMVMTGDEVHFYATVENHGPDVESFEVSFILSDKEGQILLDDRVWVDAIDPDQAMMVESPFVWEPGNTLGWHKVEVEAIIANDIAPNDNKAGLDQIASSQDNPPNSWLSYQNDRQGGLWAYPNNDNGGFGALFYHPGGEETEWLTDARLSIFALPNADLVTECRIYVFDVADGSFELAWSGQANIGNELSWAEFHLEENEYVRFDEGEGLLVAWMQSPNIRLQRAIQFPHAATNDEMPPAMFQTEDDGENWVRTTDFDAKIEVQFQSSHKPSHFDLLTPTDGDTLSESELVLNWENSEDVDPDQEVSYLVWISSADDSLSFEVDFDSLALNIAELGLVSEDEVGSFQWWVIATSDGDSIESNSRFRFVYQPLGIESHSPVTPEDLAITSITPNPFNSTVRISFDLSRSGKASLNLFDVSGRKVAGVFNGYVASGSHTVVFDSGELQSGVYLLGLHHADKVVSRKVLLLK